MVTEKEAREALNEAIAQAIYEYNGGRFDSMQDARESTFAPIDALLAARTEAIAQMLRTRGLELIDLADGNETVDNVLRAQGAAFLSAANEARRDWGDTE